MHHRRRQYSTLQSELINIIALNYKDYVKMWLTKCSEYSCHECKIYILLFKKNKKNIKSYLLFI